MSNLGQQVRGFKNIQSHNRALLATIVKEMDSHTWPQSRIMQPSVGISTHIFSGRPTKPPYWQHLTQHLTPHEIYHRAFSSRQRVYSLGAELPFLSRCFASSTKTRCLGSPPLLRERPIFPNSKASRARHSIVPLRRLSSER